MEWYTEGIPMDGADIVWFLYAVEITTWDPLTRPNSELLESLEHTTSRSQNHDSYHYTSREDCLCARSL